MTWGSTRARTSLSLHFSHFSCCPGLCDMSSSFGWWKFHVTIAVSYMRGRSHFRAWPRKIPLLYVNVSKPKAPKSIRLAVVVPCRWQFSYLLLEMPPTPVHTHSKNPLFALDWLNFWPHTHCVIAGLKGSSSKEYKCIGTMTQQWSCHP